MSVVRRGAGLVAGLAVAVVLLAACDDDPSSKADKPSADQVLDRLAEQSAALDDDALDELTAAGADDSAAEEFRSRYLAEVEGGVSRTIRGAGRGEWPATLDEIEREWVQPAAEVIGALEAGCEQSGGTCGDRLDQAELELRDAVESATYAWMPAGLLPQVFLRDGERVAMSAWTTAQKDEWQRLRNTTLLPLTSGVVEQATFARMRSAGA